MTMQRGQWTVARLLGRTGAGLLVLVLLVACGTPKAVDEAGIGSDEVTPQATLDVPPSMPAPVELAHQGAVEKADVGSDEATPQVTLDAPASTSEPVYLAHQEAPDFRLPDLDGQTWTLSEFRPRPVVLFFWASW